MMDPAVKVLLAMVRESPANAIDIPWVPSVLELIREPAVAVFPTSQADRVTVSDTVPVLLATPGKFRKPAVLFWNHSVWMLNKLLLVSCSVRKAYVPTVFCTVRLPVIWTEALAVAYSATAEAVQLLMPSNVVLPEKVHVAAEPVQRIP